MLPSRTLFNCSMLVAFFSIFATFYAFFFSNVMLTNVSTTNLLTNADDNWFEPKTKVIMMVVDALRYDYFYYNETIEGHEELTYQNRFKKVHKIVKNEPENFVVMKAFSDGPTFTVRRARAIVTGSIPPFIIVAQSLGAHEAVEDSILKRMFGTGRKVHTAGDPLWFELFPRFVIDTFQSRSFDITNMDSEIVVAEKIREVVDENKFDFLIGHTLGVDHIGHMYSNDQDPRIGEQLTASDNLISYVMEKMDNDTVLIVLGDHGMTHHGSHGGGTPEETGSVIAAYCKKGFQKYKTPGFSGVMRSIDERTTQVKQVDITPTFAMLLGVPIPFSNLGQIIDDIYPYNEATNSSSFAAQMLRDNYLNALQINKNLETFNAEAYNFKDSVLTPIRTKFQDIQGNYAKVSVMDQQTQDFQDESIKLISQMQGFSDDVYELIRGTNFFDTTLAVLGASIMFLVLIGHVLLGIHTQMCQSYDESSKASQESNCGRLFVRLATDKVLYGILFGGLIIWAIMRPKAIYVVSAVVLALTLKAVISLSIAVFAARNRFLFDKLESAKTNSKENPGANIELANKEGISEDQYSQDNARLIQITLQAKNLPENLPSTTVQVIITILVLMIGIILTNIERTVRALELSNWLYLHRHMEYVLAALFAYVVHTVFKDRKTLRNLGYVGVLIFLAIVIIVDAWIAAQIVQNIFFPPVILWFIKSHSKSLEGPYKYPLRWLHIATVSTLWMYYLPLNRESDLVAIILPRIIYGFIFVTLVAGCVLAKSSSSQNFKLCMIELLFLLQGTSHMLPFMTILMVLAATNHLFKKYRIHSYIYPMVIAVITYFGLYALDHTDRSFSHINFAQAFVGLRKFNIYLSVPMVVLNLFTSFILGMIFMSNHLQDIKQFLRGQYTITKSPGVKYSNDSENPPSPDIAQDSEKEDVKSYSENDAYIQDIEDKINLLNIRNYLVFVFFFGFVYITAVLRNFNLSGGFDTLSKEAERYAYDAGIYIFMLVSALFLIR